MEVSVRMRLFRPEETPTRKAFSPAAGGALLARVMLRALLSPLRF